MTVLEDRCKNIISSSNGETSLHQVHQNEGEYSFARAVYMSIRWRLLFVGHIRVTTESVKNNIVNACCCQCKNPSPCSISGVLKGVAFGASETHSASVFFAAQGADKLCECYFRYWLFIKRLIVDRSQSTIGFNKYFRAICISLKDDPLLCIAKIVFS